MDETNTQPQAPDAASTSADGAPDSRSSQAAPPPGNVQTPAPATDPAPAQRIKVHHSYIWLGAIVAIVPTFFAIVVGFVIPMASDARKDNSIPADFIVPLSILMGVAIIAFIFVIQALSYRCLWYEFDETEFSLYSGIFVKHRLHVPYRRVQSVNHTATLFQRFVGVCSVTIDTAGGAANKAVRVPYVTNSAAERIRLELFSRKTAMETGTATAQVSSAVTRTAAGTVSPNVLDAAAGELGTARGVFGGQEVDTGNVTASFSLSSSELLLSGISGSGTTGIIVFATIFGIATSLGGDLLLDMIETGSRGIVSAAPSSAGSVIAAMSAMFFIAMVLVAILIGLCATIISFGGFKVCRRGNRVEVEQGLIQRQFSGIDVDRVQSVIIKQTFIRRLMGCCQVSLGRIDAAESGNGGNSKQAKLNSRGLVVHPFVKTKRVPQMLRELIPEYADVPQPSTKLPGVAMRRALVRRCIIRSGWFWMLVICVLCAALFVLPIEVEYLSPRAVNWYYLLIVVFLCAAGLCAIGMIVQAISAVLWKRESAFAYNKKFFSLHNSGLSTETVYIARQKIQYGYTRRNPFQEHAHVASINVITASGIGGTKTTLWDVSEDAADEWLAWIEPNTSMVKLQHDI